MNDKQIVERLEELDDKGNELAGIAVRSWIDDLDWDPEYSLSELEERFIGVEGDQFHPNSSEAKEIRRLIVEVGLACPVSEGKTTTSGYKGYWFQVDGVKYEYCG